MKKRAAIKDYYKTVFSWNVFKLFKKQVLVSRQAERDAVTAQIQAQQNLLNNYTNKVTTVSFPSV